MTEPYLPSVRCRTPCRNGSAPRPSSARSADPASSILQQTVQDATTKKPLLHGLYFRGGMTVKALPLLREIACLIMKSIVSSVMPGWS